MGRKNKRAGTFIPRPRVSGMKDILWRIGTRDMWICWVCWKEVVATDKRPDTHPTKDHLIPVSLGGPSGMWNLRICHYRCNMNRDNKVPPPRAELLRYVDEKSYGTMAERFERAYGYAFSAHERQSFGTEAQGPCEASAIPARRRVTESIRPASRATGYVGRASGQGRSTYRLGGYYPDGSG